MATSTFTQLLNSESDTPLCVTVSLYTVNCLTRLNKFLFSEMINRNKHSSTLQLLAQ